MKSQDILLLLKIFSLSYYEKIDLTNKKMAKSEFLTEQQKKQYYLNIIYKNKESKYNNYYLNKYYGEIENLYSKIDFNSLFDENKYSLLSLEKSTGISKSQISLSLKRCIDLKLLLIRDKIPYVNTQELLNVVIPALRFFFPIKKIGNVRGIPISYSSPFLYENIVSGKKLPMVWEDANGTIVGDAIEPLYKTVPYAAVKDPLLYELLVLVDSIRLNAPREKQVAFEQLKDIFMGK